MYTVYCLHSFESKLKDFGPDFLSVSFGIASTMFLKILLIFIFRVSSVR